ncbi:MAG: hypothetical protein JSV62_12795 [Promethearchaeota archaeon]|nr:MAG: hypothetical protein JSV62_12795 [Candidatus Lokiarchaeota archaeon]
MEEIRKIIEELGIVSLESNMKIAGVAVISDSGDLIYQTENFDLTNHTNMVLDVLKGAHSFILSNTNFSVIETTNEGIIGSSDSGMGYVLFVPFHRGVLVSYAMPQADPYKALTFLKGYAIRLISLI